MCAVRRCSRGCAPRWAGRRPCCCWRTSTGPTRPRWTWSATSDAASTACPRWWWPPSGTTRSPAPTRWPRCWAISRPAAGVGRMQLPLLTAAAVAELARQSGREVDVAALHRSTDGNPFFVTEVLAAGGRTIRRPSGTPWWRAGRPVRRPRDGYWTPPPSSDHGRDRHRAECPASRAAAVDECVEGGVLLDRGTSVAFRHELARQAILDSLPPATRVDLHRRVLAGLVAAGSSRPPADGEHAVGCADDAAVVRARAAGRRAGRPAGFAPGGRGAPADRAAARRRPGAGRRPRRPAGATVLRVLPHRPARPRRWTPAAGRRPARGGRRHPAVGVGQRWLSRLSWMLGRNCRRRAVCHGRGRHPRNRWAPAPISPWPTATCRNCGCVRHHHRGPRAGANAERTSGSRRPPCGTRTCR